VIRGFCLSSYITMASSDKEAVTFWNGSFGDKKEVSVEEFADKYAARFNTYPSEVVFKIVDHFIANQSSLEKVEHINVKQFVAFLERFGPFADTLFHVTQNFFDKNGNVHRWYHFNLDREHAKRRMKSTDTFLVRDSSHKNSYVLMYAKSGSGLKEMLIEVRKGVFFVNPDQEHPEKQDTILKVITDRTKDLEPSYSTLFQAYTFEKKEDENFGIYDCFTAPATVPAVKKYSVWAAEKAALKEKSDKKISGYVPYYGGATKTDSVAPGVAAGGSAAPTGSKYATYDPSSPSSGTSSGEKSDLVNAALARAGATAAAGGHEAVASGGSKYQSYDPTTVVSSTSSAPTAVPHSNYQAYNGGQ